MKKGKTCKINGFRTFKSLYGTIDSQSLKSIYLNLQTWVEPKEEVENWNRVVLNMTRNVKHSVYENLNKEIFYEFRNKFISHRTNGFQISKIKKSRKKSYKRNLWGRIFKKQVFQILSH